MTERFSDDQASREALSAIVDGEASASEVARACSAWRDDGATRQSWQTYHLIGDVMRSEDLAQGGDGSAFLAKFRSRLEQEPVVLAPAAAAAAEPARAAAQAAVAPVVALKRRAWSGPLAVAAGFAMVVGVVVSGQMAHLTGGGADTRQMAQAPAVSPTVGQRGAGGESNGVTLASAAPANMVDLPPSNGGGLMEGESFSRPKASEPVLIRDPQVDQLLASLPRHGANGEASFASQGGLAKAAVYELP